MGYWFAFCQKRRNCTIHGDTFETHAVGTDLGALWTELSGDWAVADSDGNHVLTESTGSQAVIRSNAVDTHADGSGHVIVRVNDNNGGPYRVMLWCLDDSQYIYVEIAPASPKATIIIGYRKDGVDSELFSDTVTCDGEGTDLWFGLCIEHPNQTGSGLAIIRALYGPGPEETPTPLPEYVRFPVLLTGHAAIGNWSGGAAEFDEVTWEWMTIPAEECHDCACEYCKRRLTKLDGLYDHEPMPTQLIATIVDYSGCSAIDGTEINLLFNSELCTEDLNECACWEDYQAPLVCGVIPTVELVRWEDDYRATDPWWKLFEMTYGSIEEMEDRNCDGNLDSACWPLDLRFGPFKFSDDFECCEGEKQFMIHVTEGP